jgi:diguanylate cyclase (GGDEF)-like protein/PAS domain S-box-containing protein
MKHNKALRLGLDDSITINQDKLTFILDSIEVGLWDLVFSHPDLESPFSADDQLIWSNSMFQLFNVDPDTFSHSYKDFERCVHVEDRENIQKQIIDCIKSKKVMKIKFRLISFPNEVRYISAQAKALYDEAGNPTHLTGINNDISVLEYEKIKVQQLYEKISENEKKYRALFESSSDAIMILSENNFLECNDATLTMFGCKSRQDFLGCHPSAFSPEKQPDGRSSKLAADAYIAQSLRDGHAEFSWDHCRMTGEVFPAEVLLTPVVLNNQNLIQATVRDVTELAQLQDKLLSLSMCDKLTGLYNRHALDSILNDTVQQALQTSDPFSLIMLDIDFFKNVNDTYGHAAGDDVLKHLAKIMTSMIRKNDRAIRLGGDEFIIVLPAVNSKQACNVAESIRKRIESSSLELPQMKRTSYTVSIGIATFPADGTNGKSMLAAADRSMYRAKNSGRNKVASSDDEDV